MTSFLLFLLLYLAVADKTVNDTDYLIEFDHLTNASQALYKKIFETSNYRKDLAPIYGKTTNAFELLLELTYMRLMAIDSEIQQVRLVVEIINHWTDLRLRWDPKRFDGIEEIVVHSASIWIPEYSASDSQKFELLAPESQRFARIYSNGSIYYETTAYIEMSCKLEMWNFPFDVQKCGIGFQTYAIRKQFFNMTARISPHLDPSVMEGNGEWCLLNLTGDYSVDLPLLNFAGFLFSIHREPLYYIFVVVIPCFLLTTLSNFGMFWSTKVREDRLGKMSIGLASMMAMTVLLDVASQQIHKTYAFPLLGYYVIICTILISLGCVTVVLIGNGGENHSLKKPGLGLLSRIEQYIFTRAFAIHVLFQGLNLINLIVFLSHWNNEHPAK